MAKTRDHQSGASAGEAVMTAAAPGVYAVQLEGCPRKYVDTGMPAGPDAEAVAKDRYLAAMLLGLRHRDKVTVTLDV